MVENELQRKEIFQTELKLSADDVKLSFDADTRDSCSGLSRLENISNLFIKKEIRLGLAQPDIDTIIFNDKNEKVFYVRELLDDGCMGCCYSPKALFDMKVFDLFDNEVLYLARENQFQCSHITRRSPILEVLTPSKQKLGCMKGILSFCRIKFNVEDECGRCILKIQNVIGFPYAHFKVLSEDKTTIIGKIIRERTKTNHVLSKVCHVKVTFPIDLEIKIKAVLLCAALTLMSAYFEE